MRGRVEGIRAIRVLVLGQQGALLHTDLPACLSWSVCLREHVGTGTCLCVRPRVHMLWVFCWLRIDVCAVQGEPSGGRTLTLSPVFARKILPRS